MPENRHLSLCKHFPLDLQRNHSKAFASAALGSRIALMRRDILPLAYELYVLMITVGVNLKRYEPFRLIEDQAIQPWHSGKVDFKIEYDGF